MKILLSILFVLVFGFASKTFAKDFIVNVTIDQKDANAQKFTPSDGICDVDLVTPGEQCTLRAAIWEANEQTSIGYGIGRVFFNLPPHSTVTLTQINGGELFVSNSIEIIGTGADNLTVDGGAGTNRVFFLFDANWTISNLTITGGNGGGRNGDGAGDGVGGAIYAVWGSVILDKVVISGNSGMNGGGVYFYKGQHYISNSTIKDNTSNSYGGFFNDGGAITIINSTFSGNNAISGGGAAFGSVGGSVAMINSTITSNSTGNSNGGGIYQFSGTLNLGNTIVAGNSGGSGSDIFQVAATVTTSGGNLIGNNGSVTATFPAGIPNANNDYAGTSASPINPILGELQNNGGTTPTHALLFGSPAINAGNNSNLASATDQRGFTRIVGGRIDIGAYESNFTTPTPTPTPACTYALGTLSQSFTSSGGFSSIDVQTQAGCQFTATASDAFVSFPSGTTGTGNGTIYFNVAAMTLATPRTATITIAGQTFTINQSAYSKSRKRVRFF
jgi:hypothetical protein